MVSRKHSAVDRSSHSTDLAKHLGEGFRFQPPSATVIELSLRNRDSHPGDWSTQGEPRIKLHIRLTPGGMKALGPTHVRSLELSISIGSSVAAECTWKLTL